jgi:carbonic anhydrase
MTIRRRELLGVAGGLILGGLGTWAAQNYLLPSGDDPPGYEPVSGCAVRDGQNIEPEEAWARLLAGNRRFLEGRSQYRTGFHVPPHVLARQYRPFAVILCCSDARIAAEILFDERVSELFVIRQAAHILDDGVRMSIEFAVRYLKVPLILVLGHSGCTTLEAVLGAARDATRPDGEPPAEVLGAAGGLASTLLPVPASAAGQSPAYLARLGVELNSVVKEVHRQPGDQLDNAVAANVRYTVRLLRSAAFLQPLIKENRLQVRGASYTLPSGEKHSEGRFEEIGVP